MNGEYSVKVVGGQFCVLLLQVLVRNIDTFVVIVGSRVREEYGENIEEHNDEDSIQLVLSE